jgi:hypothetical protein
VAPSSLHRNARRSPAARLRDATRLLRESEQVVEDLLVASFPGWRPLHPRSRGWRFSYPDAIDVYRVDDSLTAADDLHRAGFDRVTAHPHDSLAPCRCRGRFPDPPGSKVSGEIAARGSPARPAGGSPLTPPGAATPSADLVPEDLGAGDGIEMPEIEISGDDPTSPRE